MAPTLKNNAFTVIEVLLSIALVTIAILALAALFISGLRLKSQLTQRALASEVAKEMVERIKATEAMDIPGTDASFDGSLPTARTAKGFPPPPYPRKTIPGGDYRIQVHLQDIVGRPRLRDLRVEVFWDENSRVKLSTRLLIP